MARKKISDFTAASALAGTDLAPVAQDGAGTLVKATLTNLKAFFQKTLPFVVGFSISGLTTQTAGVGEIWTFVFTDAVDFADDFAGSLLKANVAATASTVFTIKKNGSTVGTATVAISGTTATFVTSGGATAFAIGDILQVYCPNTPDVTLADFSIAFKGVRNL